MRSFALCATIAVLLASAATATNTSAINTTGMGHWTRPTIEGLVERTDYTERHVLYGVYNGTAWTELDFEDGPGTYAVAEVLRNPHAEHRWELIKITSLNDTDAFYTAGYAEALATHVGMFNFWFNKARLNQPNSSNPSFEVMQKLVQYIRNYPHQDTAYGRMVPQMMRQIDGLWAGWEAAYRASGSPEDMADFSWESVFFMSYGEDYENLPKPTPKPVNPVDGMTHPTHCTSVHKLLPDGTLFVGHATMDSYTTMLRQLKTYVFSGGRNVTMPSGPGLIYSSDDYNLNGHGLVMTSTELLTKNHSTDALYKPLAVPGMFGTMIASYLAETPTQWAQLFATDDAGSYSSMMMIADMRAAYAAQLSNTTLPPGTLVVLEAVPTSAHYEDMTAKLVHDGAWFSFDIAYFNVTRRLLGINNTFEYGVLDYDDSPYMAGPRRDMSFVTDATTMFYAMRHNNWPHDPAQTVPKCRVLQCPSNEPEMTRTSMFGAAPRNDLVPADFFPDASGGIDAKVTSPAMLFADPSRPVIIMQNGPTFVQQEPFSFAEYKAQQGNPVTTRGLPDTWDFPPGLLSPHAPLSNTQASGGADHGVAGGTIAAIVLTIALASVALGGFVVFERRKARRASAIDGASAGETTHLV